MASEKFIRLLTSLLEGTQEGKIKWSETASEKAFRVAFEPGLVRVAVEYSDYTDCENYFAFLQDRQGRTVDEIASYDNTAPQGLLRNLYIAARYSALRADDILEKMLMDAEIGKTVSPPDENPREAAR